MILEVQKINNQFVIQNLPESMGDHFFLNIELQDIVKERPSVVGLSKDAVYEQIKMLAEKYPEDVFLQNKLKYYVPVSSNILKSDSEIYQEYLMEQYGK
jgi:hypothetical protein